jgi:ActR/RegA family two-component response regulator
MRERRERIICWCQELVAIRAIVDAAGREFDLVWVHDASGFQAAIKQEPEPVAAMVDNRAAGANAIKLLQSVKESRPKTRRVLLSDYCDLAIIVQGLHTGAVQQLVYKPVHAPELLAAFGLPMLPIVMAHTPNHPPMRAVV